MTVLITLTLAGADVGPFDLYSDADGYASPFETGVLKASLQGGYNSTVVPNTATIIRVASTGVCTNYVDLPITGIPATTTTTTTAAPTTTTTSTTHAPTTTTTTTITPTTTTTTTANNPIDGDIVFNGTANTITYNIMFAGTAVNPSAPASGSSFISGSTPYISSSMLVQVTKTSNSGISEGAIDIRWFVNGVQIGSPYTDTAGNFINPQRTMTGLVAGDVVRVEILEG